MRRGRTAATLAACLVTALLAAIVVAPQSASAGNETARTTPYPVLAYYYIWFNATSWSRAKNDFPLLGRYSSDEERVMRQHIKWAKAAGIDGFLVSWKSTTTLDNRLEKLTRIANEEDFKLGIVYQALDFEREPLPVRRIRADLDFFIERFASDPAFNIFEKPVVIWTGTEQFKKRQIGRTVAERRDDLLVLASEKSTKGIERLGKAVDGNAYYWSSVDPQSYENFSDKLVDMGNALHELGGLWIAPAAPGFDARLVGGASVVERRGGATVSRATRRSDALGSRCPRHHQLERVLGEHTDRAKPAVRRSVPRGSRRRRRRAVQERSGRRLERACGGRRARGYGRRLRSAAPWRHHRVRRPCSSRGWLAPLADRSQ